VADGGSSIDQMLNSFGRFVVLNPGQQLEASRLVRRWLDWEGGPDAAPPRIKRAGMRAKRRMVETNMRLVVSVARRYVGRGLPLEDLVQEGALGLTRAIELFDPARGYQFSTFSYWWVRQAMTRALSNFTDTIRIPCNLTDKIRRVNHYVQQEQHKGNRPSDAQIAKALELSAQQMRLLRMAAAGRTIISLDRPMVEDGNDFVDLIPCPNSTTHDPLDDVDHDLNASRLGRHLARLNDNEQFVIRSRYLEGQSLRSIAKELGVTSERARQISSQACNRLRLWMTQEGQQAAMEGGKVAAAIEDPVAIIDLPSVPPCRQQELVQVLAEMMEDHQARRPHRKNRRRSKGDPGQMMLEVQA
jgi:RNA polymerase primary sigma factor